MTYPKDWYSLYIDRKIPLKSIKEINLPTKILVLMDIYTKKGTKNLSIETYKRFKICSFLTDIFKHNSYKPFFKQTFKNYARKRRYTSII